MRSRSRSSARPEIFPEDELECDMVRNIHPHSGREKTDPDQKVARHFFRPRKYPGEAISANDGEQDDCEDSGGQKKNEYLGDSRYGIDDRMENLHGRAPL